MTYFAPRGLLDSLELEFWIPRRGFRILGTRFRIFFSVIPDIFNR